MTAPIITQEILKELLHYDPETGVFTWLHRPLARENWNTRYAGKVAGFEWSPDGKTTYRSIRIFDWPFMAHRLSVLYMTGEWPPVDVDHRDLDGLNNRWLNLRLATKSQNGANRGVSIISKTGLKGVSPDNKQGGYKATIGLHGRQHFLGRYDTREDAQAAYAEASKRLHGEFGRIA